MTFLYIKHDVYSYSSEMIDQHLKDATTYQISLRAKRYFKEVEWCLIVVSADAEQLSSFREAFVSNFMRLPVTAISSGNSISAASQYQ